jgi:peptidoglycan/xylan/chitin deacetylase (PgdA/CDA1 family)
VTELRIALTFDAEHPSRRGSGPDSLRRILDTLSSGAVRGTFFVQGRWASAYTDVARRIAVEGHQVGNHSNYHAPMTLLSREGIRTDVQESERRIRDVAGVDPRPWFRCPFGDGADRPEVLDQLSSLGYRNVGWTVDSGDWQHAESPDQVEAAVLEGIRSGLSQTVVLFHTWPLATASALPRLINHLRDEGASFVTVGELDDEA